jgi:hypothetical protein
MWVRAMPWERNSVPSSTSAKSKSNGRKSGEVNIERRSSTDRRKTERRTAQVEVAVERRQLERRQKVNRRRQIDPTTCERDYSDDEVEFMQALDRYKRSSGRMFPTCSELLEVLRGLGYAKITNPIAAPPVEPSIQADPPDRDQD